MNTESEAAAGTRCKKVQTTAGDAKRQITKHKKQKKSNSKFQSEPEFRKRLSAIGYDLSPGRSIHPIICIYFLLIAER